MPQEVPKIIGVATMNAVVCAIATPDVVEQRHRPVGGDVEAKDKLLQVGTMVLVVAEDDTGFVARGLVAAREGDGGGVEMDAASLDLEVLDDAKSETEEHVPAAF